MPKVNKWREVAVRLMNVITAMLEEDEEEDDSPMQAQPTSAKTSEALTDVSSLVITPEDRSTKNCDDRAHSYPPMKLRKPYWQSHQEILTGGMTIKFYRDEEYVSKRVKTMVLNRVTSRWNEVLDSRIKEYLEAGVIVPVEKKQVRFVAPIAIVPRHSDPSRPREVLDFTLLNRHIIDVDCVLPSRKDLVAMVQQYSYAASIDIKSCYTNIKLHEDYRPYCCICWRGQFYMFTKVPFGIKCAPACCQTVTKALSGEATLVYLDDYLVLGRSETEVHEKIAKQQMVLEGNGLPISVQKSCLTPKQELEYCGYRLCFGEENRGVYTTDKHLRDLSLYVKVILSKQQVDVKTWRQFLGKYNWCRARNEDRQVHVKLVGLLNEHIERGEAVVNLDDTSRDMLSKMVERCSLPFDY